MRAVKASSLAGEEEPVAVHFVVEVAVAVVVVVLLAGSPERTAVGNWDCVVAILESEQGSLEG